MKNVAIIVAAALLSLWMISGCPLPTLTAADADTASATVNIVGAAPPMPSVPSMAALRAIPSGSSSGYVATAGYYTPGDGGDALYYWDPNATCADDGGSCIAPNN